MNINMPSNEQIRKQIERLYCGTMTVFEKQNILDENTSITHQDDVAVIEDEPCRVSYSNILAAEPHEGARVTAQSIKLFCSPELIINEGSKIVVTQHGTKREYRYSGTGVVYRHHQEINLELTKELT